mmetsp:Transcript_1044/g.2096  ORF Transcript_1044/g.2096 Transcript_1044/m.2096 type:complete len:214 (-) Transcript_1044:1138-1779(-)
MPRMPPRVERLLRPPRPTEVPPPRRIPISVGTTTTTTTTKRLPARRPRASRCGLRDANHLRGMAKNRTGHFVRCANSKNIYTRYTTTRYASSRWHRLPLSMDSWNMWRRGLNWDNKKTRTNFYASSLMPCKNRAATPDPSSRKFWKTTTTIAPPPRGLGPRETTSKSKYFKPPGTRNIPFLSFAGRWNLLSPASPAKPQAPPWTLSKTLASKS